MISFDFQATSIPEFSKSLLMSEKADALLPVGVIYGPNGGGKTNLLLALSCLISTVVNPIYELEKAREKVIIQLDVHGAGDNTLSLLDKAMNLVRSNPNGYKHVWIVYDTDDFPANRINKTNELCINLSTEETQYHAIWSNQCIELWFLLHFSFFQSDIHRSDYWPKLSEWLKNIGQGEYSKGRRDMFQILWPFMDFAIANAERLDAMNEGKPPASSAPGTKAHVLIKHLRPYLKIE